MTEPHDRTLMPDDAVARLAHARVLVVGDAMLDRYVFGKVGRISPEAPVPVLMVAKELSEPGGAGNVVHNLCALGAAVAFVSVVGDDAAGAELTGLIGTQAGVEPWLLVQGGRITTTKSRFVAEGSRRGGQHLLRADHEDTRPIHPKLAERLLRIAGDAMAATSLLVLSDYRKGTLAGDMPARLIARAQAAGRRVVADLRADDFARYAGADVLMPHARDMLPESDEPSDAAVVEAGLALCVRHGFGALLVKRGEDGLSLVSPQEVLHFRLHAPDLVDLSGAGDAAVAALAAGMAAGLELAACCRLANIAAGVIGANPGSLVVQPGALLAALALEDARAAG
jgi:D-beta-D-heptose 7-phosphate kinase/D-beta-D-heptose 1-phosphate adenosyltransferase